MPRQLDARRPANLEPAKGLLHRSEDRLSVHRLLRPVTTVGLLLALTAGAAADDSRRFIAADASGGAILWTNWRAFNHCARARTPQSQRLFCDEGFAGLPPKVGVLDAGVPVEVLGARDCRDLARVRVLAGALRGSTGCIDAQRLTRSRLDTAPAAGTPSPATRPRLVSRRSRLRPAGQRASAR